MGVTTSVKGHPHFPPALFLYSGKGLLITFRCPVALCPAISLNLYEPSETEIKGSVPPRFRPDVAYIHLSPDWVLIFFIRVTCLIARGFSFRILIWFGYVFISSLFSHIEL